jgi:hypothetical protein
VRAKTISVTGIDRRRLWSRVLEADPQALVTQSPEWIDALVSLGTWRDATRLWESADGRLVVLPLARRASVLASPPGSWGFGGIVAEGGVTRTDIHMVLTDLRSQRALAQSIRPNPLLAAAWERGVPEGWTAVPRFAHVVDLRSGSEAAWKGFEKDGRRRVRRAERLGVEVECDSTGHLIPVFYELLEASIARWAAAQNEPLRLARWRARRRDPIEKFRAMAGHIGSQFRLRVAFHHGRPVAANLVLQGKNAHTTRGVMDRELAGPLSATALLEWRAIQDACRSGCSYYHMGETGASDRLARNKQKFGAVGHAYDEYRRDRIPLSRIDSWSRRTVKRIIGFKD